MLYWRRNNDADKPVVLVDEPFMPLYISDEADKKRTEEFFRSFFSFTESNLTSRMLLVSSYPIESYCIPYAYDCFPNDIYTGRISSLFFLNKHEILEYLQNNGVKTDSEKLEKLFLEERERFKKYAPYVHKATSMQILSVTAGKQLEYMMTLRSV